MVRDGGGGMRSMVDKILTNNYVICFPSNIT